MNFEIQPIDDNNVWELIDPIKNGKAIGYMDLQEDNQHTWENYKL